jgi:choline dehydrogenase-like flavoprotein
MGNDPATSVVDPYGRAHDVPNLFLAGGSIFVTGGSANPTCTISALALRVAEHIAANAKGEKVSA